MVRPGEDVLDVGCGTGAQSLLFANRVRPGGSVSAVDISAESVETLRAQLGADDPVQAETGDMADLQRFIDEVFAVKRYDLAQSTYALYYADERDHVLQVMKAALKPGGRLAVFTPNMPHGLVALGARFGHVPQSVFDSLRFGTEILEPWFRENFTQVVTDYFHNEITIPTVDHLLEFYRSTTYYDAEAEAKICDFVAAEIAEKGSFSYEKNGFLVIGSDG